MMGSTIWSLMRLPSSSIVRILKSIPIVVIKEGVHASSQKRRRRQDLPTPDSTWLRNSVKCVWWNAPESPISRSCYLCGQCENSENTKKSAYLDKKVIVRWRHVVISKKGLYNMCGNSNIDIHHFNRTLLLYHR